MHVLFLRHATRDPHAAGDIGLTAYGTSQAQGLIGLVKPRGRLPAPTALLTSPKRRARETLLPLARALGLDLSIVRDLDERENDESPSAFYARVRNWIEALDSSFGGNDVIWVCSHLDWLDEAIHLIPSDLADWELERSFAPAEYRLFEVRSGVWYAIE